MNLNAISVLALLALFAGFAGVFVLNSQGAAQQQPLISVPVPYFFAPGDVVGVVNSFLFVFVFSLLFFGFGAPIALGLEGAKYAFLISAGGMKFFDLAFAVPQIFAAMAATVLGRGIIDDYRGVKTVFDYWDSALGYLALGVAVLFVLLVFRPFVIGFF